MAVSLSRTGSTGTVAVTMNVADLIADAQAGRRTLAQAKAEAIRRAAVEISDAAGVLLRTDEQIDADAQAAANEAARLKALRPAGSL